MKAWRVPRAGDARVMELVDIEAPEPGPGEVRVRLEAIGVNFLDIQQRLDNYPVGVRFPFIAGVEGAGVVEKLGPGVGGLAVGDEVAFTDVPGAYAEAVTAPAERLVPLPEGIDARTAAAVLLQGLTARIMTGEEVRRIGRGDWVLVHAGAGGTGGLVVQAAKARGATVVATVSTAPKERVAREHGADHVVRYDAADFAAACRALPCFPGFAVVYDSIGGPTLERGLGLLRRKGLMVSFGKAGGPLPRLDLDALNRLGSLSVTRFNMMFHIVERAELLRFAGEVLDAVLARELRPRIGAEFPLAEAPEAQQALAGRGTIGKLLLIP